MSPKKISRKKTINLENIQSLMKKNISIEKINPAKIIQNTKKKIGNYYLKLQKDREKEKIRLEKKRKSDEKKDQQRQKKQAQKERLDKIKEEKHQILAQQKLIVENEKKVRKNEEKRRKIEAKRINRRYGRWSRNIKSCCKKGFRSHGWWCQ